MNKNKFSAVSLSIVLVIFLTMTSLGQGKEREPSLAASRAIAGSWYMTVTSNTFPVPFRALLTFGEGGGVVASAQGDILLQPPPGVPPVATAAHGAWLRTANREFLFTFRQIFYNSDGTYAGGAKIRNAAFLDASGNNMSGELIVQYLDANDQIVFTGTGNFTASRIVAETLNP